MSFVVADLDGQGVRCRRVFSTTLHAADGVIGVDKSLENGFRAWCKEHGRDSNIKLIKPVSKGSSLTKTETVELETPKTKAKKSAKIAKAELAIVAEAPKKGFKAWCKAKIRPMNKSSKFGDTVTLAEPKEEPKNPQLATVAEALAKGGMKPTDVAKVLRALM